MIVVLSYLVIIFGFIAPLVFILGIAYRIWNWKRLSTGFSWGLFPKPTNNTTTSILWKVFVWPTLFKTDRFLWVIALFLHIGLLFLLVGHLGNFLDIIAFAEMLGIPSQAAYEIGIVAGIIAGTALLLFISRRIFSAKAQQVSSINDHFWLWFLLLVVGVGIYARLFDTVSSEAAREFSLSIITLNPVLPPGNLWFLVHIFLAEIFIIYSMAGKPIHLAGQFFTQYILVSEKR